MAAKTLRGSAPFNNKIKRMMQADEDVGKVAKASPVLISAALEVFLKGLLEGAVEVARSRGARTLTNSHIKAHVASAPLLDFCQPAVENAPDLPPPGSEEPAAPPGPLRVRKHSAADGDEGAPPKRGRAGSGRRGRGRGRGQGATETVGHSGSAQPFGEVDDLAAEPPVPAAAAQSVHAKGAAGGEEGGAAALLDSVPSFLMAAAPAGMDDDDDDYDA